ncbi:hypothetical protein [Amycolatopsis australiensis]|uniref:hypothetical protein n=1 Tax=Amycolatopsis australiensis TaxID=546364 RepID=UPI0015A6CA7F|nr:hypothetical protein [Amycolatopsis australiensis]
MKSRNDTTRPPARRHRRALLAVAGVAAAALAGCSNSPPPAPAPPPPIPPASPVPLPPPGTDGPELTIDGQVTWTMPHPGCVQLAIGSQVFTLVGPAAESRSGAVRAGTAPHSERVRITGYVARVGASVCGAQRNLVAQRIEPTTG